VDKLTKATHFILVKTTHKATNIEKIYMKEVSRLLGVPKEIVSDRDPKFTSNFQRVCSKIWDEFKFQYNISPRVRWENIEDQNNIEEMLRMYVMDQPSKWEDYIHLVKFSYNNGYQASLKMSPFEELYGRKCNTPVSWDNPADRGIIGQIC
jgi:hypothetical protein